MSKKLKQFQKKPIIIEAIKWEKQGDHPNDDCYEVTPKHGVTFMSEGKVVRRFCHPKVMSLDVCEYKGCNHTIGEHGWIDTVQGGHRVCPGDWIITERGSIKEGYYPCKPDVFEETYEKYENSSRCGCHPIHIKYDGFRMICEIHKVTWGYNSQQATTISKATIIIKALIADLGHTQHCSLKFEPGNDKCNCYNAEYTKLLGEL